MAFVSNFLVPIIELVFIGGVILFILYWVIRALRNAWTKSWKFIWKYVVMGKKYPEQIVDWVFSCIDSGIGWYDAKKLMLIKMTPQKMINETLWIYDKIFNELNKEKGGIKKYGKQFERSYCKKIGEYPTISSTSTSSNPSSNSTESSTGNRGVR